MLMKNKKLFLILLFLVFIVLLSFGRVADNSFINFDDTAYITENIHIQSGFNVDTIQWALTTTYFSYWHPLTWLSHMLDWKFFGAKPAGHHVVNVLFHIGAVIFVFLFLNKTTGNLWASAFAATFFAIHPLRVESVAWASERKDVLGMFFGAGCLYIYAFYCQAPKLSKYLLCLTMFVLALMSKPTMITLPFVLLLLDYWPLQRWHKAPEDPLRNTLRPTAKIIGEKIPFFCLTIAVCMITFWAQNRDGQVASLEFLPFVNRLSNALVSYTFYLKNTLWPYNLSIFYPYEYSLPLWKTFVAGIILVTTTFGALYYIKRVPFLFTGWFIYLITLVPVVGFIQSGGQAMADRYTYLPSIGLVIIFTWAFLSTMKTKRTRKKILFPVATIIIISMAFLTWRQCGYWNNSIEIFSLALRATQNNFLAHNSRGIAYGETGQFQKAVDDFDKAISFKPDYFKAYNNRGLAYTKSGQYQKAIHDFTEAINLKPDYAKAYSNRSHVFLHQGNMIEGCNDAQKACSLGICSTLEQAKLKGLCK